MKRCSSENVDTRTIASGLRDSFVDEGTMTIDELHETAQTWVNIEENEFVIAEEVIEALADLEAEKGMSDDERNVYNEEVEQQTEQARASPMDLETIPLPMDAEMDAMFDSIKRHLLDEKEGERACPKTRDSGKPASSRQAGKRNIPRLKLWLLQT